MVANNHQHHNKLNVAVINHPMDYEPWGKNERWADPTRAYPDCSQGCRHYYKLARRGGEPLEMDWGVCASPKSHRCGLLTFEHQGCEQAETGK